MPKGNFRNGASNCRNEERNEIIPVGLVMFFAIVFSAFLVGIGVTIIAKRTGFKLY
jgi:hypothetical protein